jgi:hypothetical protein
MYVLEEGRSYVNIDSSVGKECPSLTNLLVTKAQIG